MLIFFLLLLYDGYDMRAIVLLDNLTHYSLC